jgi:hypothetical protein
MGMAVLAPFQSAGVNRLGSRKGVPCLEETGKDDMNPNVSGPERQQDRVTAILNQLLQQHGLMRAALAWGLVWVWITVFSFTTGLTREIILIGSRYSGGGSGILVLVNSLIAVSALFPLFVAWMRLLDLTRLLANVLMRFAISGPGDEYYSQRWAGELQHELHGAVYTFARWARWLAVAWIVFLLASMVGSAIVVVLAWQNR